MSGWTDEERELARSRDWSCEPAGAVFDDAVRRLCVPEWWGEIARPSRDARATLALLDLHSSGFAPEDMRITYASITLDKRTGSAPGEDLSEWWWECTLTGKDWESEGHGRTLPLAVCRAFLQFREDADPPQSATPER